MLFLTGPEFKRNDNLQSLAIWDTRGRARIYRANVNQYCYRDGVILYHKMLEAGNRRHIRGTWFAGRPGEEKAIRKDTESDSARIYDRINCKIATAKQLTESAKTTNRTSIPLLEKHGFLDLGPGVGDESFQNTLVRFIRAGTASPVTLPFGRRRLI